MERFFYSINSAAKELNTTPRTIHRKMEVNGIEPLIFESSRYQKMFITAEQLKKLNESSDKIQE